MARAIAEAIVAVNPKLVYVALAGAKGKLMTEIGKEVGLKVRYEAFPDRAYTPEGTLVSRREPGGRDQGPRTGGRTHPAHGKGGKDDRAVDGSEIALKPDTLCVHGDNPSAVDLVRVIRERLESEGVSLKPMSMAD